LWRAWLREVVFKELLLLFVCMIQTLVEAFITAAEVEATEDHPMQLLNLQATLHLEHVLRIALEGL